MCIPALEFAYDDSPEHLRSLVSSMWNISQVHCLVFELSMCAGGVEAARAGTCTFVGAGESAGCYSVPGVGRGCHLGTVRHLRGLHDPHYIMVLLACP